MKDYSETVAEIRRENKELERRRQPQLDDIKDKVISYLLKEIQKRQELGKRRVEAFHLKNSFNPGKLELEMFPSSQDYYSDKEETISSKKLFWNRGIHGNI